MCIFSNHPKNNTENEENSLVSDAKDSYSYLGRIISHSASISGLEFGARENGEVLLSVGQDRCVDVQGHSLTLF